MKLLSKTFAKTVYFLVIFGIFAASFTLGLNVRAKELGIQNVNIEKASALPILMGDRNFPVLSAQGVIAIDEGSGVTLYEKNPDMALYPASTTKILTALVALDYYKLEDKLVTQDALVEGQKLGLMRGEEMTFENLLNALLIYSANDAALTIADNYPGGRDGFVAAMNAKVNSLHLENSHFANPIGLDDPSQMTTARDMVRVSEVAMKNPIFREVVGTKTKVVSDTSGKFNYKVSNVNELLGNYGVVGIKTGWTEGARENLITDVNQADHNVYIALLGSSDRFGETKELIDWVYGNYSWQKVGFVQKAVSSLF